MATVRFSRLLLTLAWCGLVFLGAIAVSGCQQSESISGVASGDRSPVLVGIQPVGPSKIVELLPENATQPVVLAFKSKYCHDCQQMAPHLAVLQSQHPQLVLKHVDVQYDKANYGQVIEAFSPSTVPAVVVIAPGGQIFSSTVGYQDLSALQAAVAPVL